ncbi:MAG: CDP-alcohol phosphatidyltransferase family protein [Gammaproteobacteria bacterium]|nr:MAG: CDP-alcohol phosphatidyltransferase family protein [Gammaproteobacteria bacterium]
MVRFCFWNLISYAMNYELRLTAVLGASLVLLFYAGLSVVRIDHLELVSANQWLLQAGLTWGWVCWQLWQRRDLNRPHSQAPLYPNLGLANRLTLLRGGLIALAAGFLWQSSLEGVFLWLPGLLYGLSAVLDRVDGFVARKSRRTSLLGSQLDMAFDALGLLVAPLLAVGLGKLHWSYLLLSVAFYIFQIAFWLRVRRGFPVYPMLPSMLRRALAGFQMGVVALVLLPVFEAQVTRTLGLAFMLPVLIGFGVDWLVVTGRIRGTSLFTRFQFFSETFLQPALRLLMVVALVAVCNQIESALTSGIFLFGLSLGAVLVLTGLGGRLGALLILLLLAAQYPNTSLTLTAYLLLFSGTGVLLLGTGRFSPWQGDAAWINRHDGA